MSAYNELLLNDPSGGAQGLDTSCPMATGRLGNLASINRVAGFDNPAKRWVLEIVKCCSACALLFCCLDSFWNTLRLRECA